MLRVPAASDEVVNCAVQDGPPASTHVTGLPMLAPSLLNCTVPPGELLGPLSALTVAVNVTATPWSTGFNEETTVVAVLYRSPVVVTVLLSTFEKLAVVLE